MPAFSGSSLERDSRAAGTALFSLRIDQGTQGQRDYRLYSNCIG